MADDTPSLPTPRPGTIGWVDLTVPDAAAVRDFYGAVAGWSSMDVEMGGYQDYAMLPAGGDAPAAGICHARGVNAGIPAQWLVYITVEDLDASVRACEERGGAVVHGPRNLGSHGRMVVIRDPAGAVCALHQAQQAAGTG